MLTTRGEGTMDATLKGPWSQAQVDEYLASSVYPLRLACVGKDGFPRVVSVWYHYLDGRLHCVSHRASQLIALLRDNERVGFEVGPNEPPYHGVRGQGMATLSEEGAGETLACLLQRYLGGGESPLGEWLLSRREEEILISISPRRIFSWDYRQRMKGTGAG
jgi:nitroimidazol reductase NimA-like FMN-containing flavoprotein (pyridoxamine 5'-phosphate oxidase superfamily)